MSFGAQHDGCRTQGKDPMMIRLWTLPLIANIPAELLVWIVIGIVWVIAQVFAKRNKRSQETGSSERPRNVARSTPRPSVNTDPVSPNDELRHFLRKIAGETDEESANVETEPWPRRQASGSADSARTAARPAATRRTADEPRRHPSPAPPPLRSTPPPPPARKPQRQAPAVHQRRSTPPARIMGAQRTGFKPTAFPRQRATPGPVITGLGNWQTAVLHREILGPPRALRPYSPTEF